MFQFYARLERLIGRIRGSMVIIFTKKFQILKTKIEVYILNYKIIWFKASHKVRHFYLYFFLFKSSTYFIKNSIESFSISLRLGPTYWPGLCVTGKKQSPINIVTEDTFNTDIGELKFIRYDFAFECKITNNGHSGKYQNLKYLKHISLTFFLYKFLIFLYI